MNAYIGCLVVATLAGYALSWRFVGPPQNVVALIALTVLGVLSNMLREPDVGLRVSFSFLSIILIASVVLVGPVGAATVGCISLGFEPRRSAIRARLFNGSMSAILGLVGGLVYLVVGGAPDLGVVEGPVALISRVGLPLMVADVAQMLTNAALLAAIVHFDNGVPFRRFFLQMVSKSGVAYIGYGFIGFLFVILWVPADVGPFSAVLILAPLFVARWAFVQYGDEHRAHQSTLNALVAAVETKDPYAVGHSERVARLAEWIAEPLSLRVQDVESLRFAAMLHDVGKIGLPTRLVRRVGTVSPEEVAAYTRHPELGTEIVHDIEFLTSSLAGIRHHHERWDGTGYPAGLRGEDIPLASRIIAVADAFDALTVRRPGGDPLTPDEALAAIAARAGTHFDVLVVAALAQTLERHSWVAGRDLDPPRERRPLGADGDYAAYLDHDDPRIWDRVRALVDSAPPKRPDL